MTLLEKMKSGELYDCSFEAIPEELNNRLYECKELIHDFNTSRPSEVEMRDEIIRKVFAEVGENCYIEPPFHANWGCNMHVGNNFYSNFNLTVVDDADIYIGDSVMIAPNVTIATGTHPVCPELREKVYQYNLPVRIGNRVWIGAGAIILPGVTIGEDSVIGAGSVVTKDIPAGVVAVGNPCRVLREINEYDYEYYRKGCKIGFTVERD
ncbi:MAG: sugar O-acetyltransferase [Clostridia bacterium]|nr:sugar O-acetyltransferase [Clostridia bacterium]